MKIVSYVPVSFKVGERVEEVVIHNLSSGIGFGVLSLKINPATNQIIADVVYFKDNKQIDTADVDSETADFVDEYISKTLDDVWKEQDQEQA